MLLWYFHSHQAWLLLSFLVGGRWGTNNKAEIIALWGVLCTANCLNINDLQVSSNSKGSIDWVRGLSGFHPPLLENWMKLAQWSDLSAHLLQSHLHEQNLIADMLSKRGVDSAPGAIHSAAFNHDFRTDSLIFLLQFLNRHLYFWSSITHLQFHIHYLWLIDICWRISFLIRSAYFQSIYLLFVLYVSRFSCIYLEQHDLIRKNNYVTWFFQHFSFLKKNRISNDDYKRDGAKS